MEKSDLRRGIAFISAGLCILLAALFTESALDGLLWGFAGGAIGPGIGLIVRSRSWSAPQRVERYRKIREQKDIEQHDERNENLRDKSGRIAYLAGLLIICASEVVFSILGKMGLVTDHKIILLYLFGLFVLQVLIWFIAYHQLRKKY